MTDKSIPTEQPRADVPDSSTNSASDAPTTELTVTSGEDASTGDGATSGEETTPHEEAADGAATSGEESAGGTATAGGAAGTKKTTSSDEVADGESKAADPPHDEPDDIADQSADEAEQPDSVPSDEAANATQDDGAATAFWRRRSVLIPAAVVAGLVIVYGAAVALAGGSLARNATVLGVDIGGLSRAEAEATLAAELPALVNDPIEVEVTEVEATFSLTPSESGLGVDYAATVADVPGGSANPISLFRALVGGGPVDPVPTIDRQALEGVVGSIGEDSDAEPTNASIGFDDGEIVTSEAEEGSALDVGATADLIESEYFGAEGVEHSVPLGPVAAVVDTVEPNVTDADVERIKTEFAEPAMSGPVSVTAGEHTIELQPEMVSAALTIAPDDDGNLAPVLGADELAEAAEDVLAAVGQPGRDATIRVEGGVPTIIPEEIGVGIAPDELAKAVLPVLKKTGDKRSAEVEFEQIEPEFTATDAEELGVTEATGGEVIGEHRTEFEAGINGYRNTNLGLAASKIDNTLLMPGDTFSLNKLVGERTEANGFARGAVIDGGQLIAAVGGGVSQVATTTYHAAFLAGLEDVEHKPHSIYYGKYPVGAEATVSWGNFDMAFKNDSPYGVLVDVTFIPAGASDGSLEVELWSTEYFRVETSTSERHSYTSPPAPTYNSSPDCYPNSPSQGFSVTTYRKVWDPDGNLVKDESYPWTYRHSPEVICGEEPKN